MRRALRRRVEPRPDETVVSLASRLAARNATTLRGFCLDMNMPLHAVHDGRLTVTHGMAELAGYDPHTFAASMLTRHGGADSRDWSYRGQRLRTANLSRSCRRVCPLCIADDIAGGSLKPEELAYARCVWRIRHLRTCAVHGVALIEVNDPFDKNVTYDTVQVYRGLINRLSDTCHDAVRREPSRFEAYLLRRLHSGAGGIDWLDRKPMWSATHLVERIGTADMFGRSWNLNELTENDWWEVGRNGFELIEGGPEGTLSILDRLHGTFEVPRTGPVAPVQIYGHLWRWIEKAAEGSEYDDIKAVMREHALSRLPLAAGTEVLGQVLERRRVHSLRSIHVETGRHRYRLRKILEAHGLLPEGHDGTDSNQIILDSERLTSLLADLVAPMKTPEVVAYLGLANVPSLIREGLITPILATQRRAGQHEFAREMVECLMMDLHRDAEILDNIGPDQISLADARKIAGRETAKLITLVRVGHFGKVWRLKNENGINSVVLLRSEVRSLNSRPGIDELARHQVIRRLRVNHLAVQQLIEKKVLPEVRRSVPRGGMPGSYVTEADLKAFEDRYVALSELARTRKMCLRDLKRKLVAEGIEPIFPPEVFKASFYLRSQV